MVELSIIIPVYNTEQYLKRCLESIFNQDFQDFEVICVNDGSTDDSLKILEEFGKKYPSLKIINIEHQNSGIARNLALEQAIGKYILYADSDDWFVKGAFTTLLNMAEDSDLCIFGAFTCENGKLRLGKYSSRQIPKKYFNSSVSLDQIKKNIFKFPTTCWTKLYKREFLLKNKILFQDIEAGQDQLFFINTMLTAQNICFLNKNLYCYHKSRPGSITSAKKKKTSSPIYVFYAIENLVKNQEDAIRFMILNNYFKKVISWFPKMEINKKEDFYNEFLCLNEHIKKNYPEKWWSKFNLNSNDTYLKVKLKMYFTIFIEFCKHFT